MTGHIVLTSLHAHNAASAIARLRDMDVEPGLIANALNCIVAQRLVRLLCTECREPYQVPAAGILPEAPDRPDEVMFHRAVGCTRCDQTGYAGRTALHEVMQVRGEVRDMIERSEEDVFAAAVRRGWSHSATKASVRASRASPRSTRSAACWATGSSRAISSSHVATRRSGTRGAARSTSPTR